MRKRRENNTTLSLSLLGLSFILHSGMQVFFSIYGIRIDIFYKRNKIKVHHMKLMELVVIAYSLTKTMCMNIWETVGFEKKIHIYAVVLSLFIKKCNLILLILQDDHGYNLQPHIVLALHVAENARLQVYYTKDYCEDLAKSCACLIDKIKRSSFNFLQIQLMAPSPEAAKSPPAHSLSPPPHSQSPLSPPPPPRHSQSRSPPTQRQPHTLPHSPPFSNSTTGPSSDSNPPTTSSSVSDYTSLAIFAVILCGGLLSLILVSIYLICSKRRNKQDYLEHGLPPDCAYESSMHIQFCSQGDHQPTIEAF